MKQGRISEVLIALARLSLHAPKGRFALAMLFLRMASRNGVTPSVYGPIFQSRWQDLTFRFCVSGYNGSYLSNFLQRFDRPFSFIDVGANVGLYSLLAAGNKNCCRCYAFEPNPAVFESLSQNVRLNNCGCAELVNSAVSAESGDLRFCYADSHTGAGSLDDRGSALGISVSSVNRDYFDNLAALDDRTKIVKIDVEGHEPVVISELMRSKVWDTVEFLFFECDESKYDVQEVVRALVAKGFKQIHKNDIRDPYDLMFRRFA
mgnify:CR=1 FL=1|jgi:FkbM family methyltransferase